MLSNRQLFLKHIAQTSAAPMLLEFEKAEGIYVYDTNGKPYVDLISGFAVNNIGHGNKQVIDAIKSQVEKYTHLMVYGEVVQNPQVKYAQKLTEHLPENLNSVYFTNSGAEATEGAMKLAKRLTNRANFVHFKNSYHGSTQGALSVMGDEYFKQNYRPLLPGITTLEYGNISQLNEINEQVAAVIIDAPQAESGVQIPTVKFMQALRKRCTDVGALLIMDEAQTGFGRTGKLWGFEHFDIVPDILLLAKAIGGGMPLGAFISSQQNMQVLTENPVLGHITTFGGHPVSCAAGLAAFEFLLNENLIEEVEAKGKLFEKLLTHKLIKTLRRKGLMLSLEFENFEQNKEIIHRCIANGVITDWFLFAPNRLRICPPLIITDTEIEEVCAKVLRAIEA
ncbi:MAG TPA: aspartate aminotransferase family protein [Chitinophagales bacterium]